MTPAAPITEQRATAALTLAAVAGAGVDDEALAAADADAGDDALALAEVPKVEPEGPSCR